MNEATGVKKELQILIIEDNADDLFRIDRELKKAGLVFCAKRVLNRDDFLIELQNNRPDLILSDHGLPSFDGFTALDIVQKRCPDVPFIFVTGSNDHGMVAEMYESGAADYVYKNHLSDLVPAVQQALSDAGEQVQEKDVRPEIDDVHRRSKAIPQPKTEGAPLAMCSSCKKVQNDKGHWESIEVYLRKHSEATITLALCPACAGLRTAN